MNARLDATQRVLLQQQQHLRPQWSEQMLHGWAAGAFEVDDLTIEEVREVLQAPPAAQIQQQVSGDFKDELAAKKAEMDALEDTIADSFGNHMDATLKEFRFDLECLVETTKQNVDEELVKLEKSDQDTLRQLRELQASVANLQEKVGRCETCAKLEEAHNGLSARVVVLESDVTNMSVQVSTLEEDMTRMIEFSDQTGNYLNTTVIPTLEEVSTRSAQVLQIAATAETVGWSPSPISTRSGRTVNAYAGKRSVSMREPQPDEEPAKKKTFSPATKPTKTTSPRATQEEGKSEDNDD